MIFTLFKKLLLFFCLQLPVLLPAQVMMKGRSDLQQLHWWLGLKTGLTFSQVKIGERFSPISYASADKATSEEKKYSGTLSNLGQTVGIIAGYAFTPNFMLTFQPAYSNYAYTYSTQHVWQRPSGEEYAFYTKQVHRLGYIELPLTAMFRIQLGHIEPYVHVGWYYGFYAGGRKKVISNEILTEAGLRQEKDKQTEVIGMSDQLMKWQMGPTGGIGAAYTIQYFRIGLELAYRQAFYNMTNVKNRYANTHLTSHYYDLPDNLKLNQLELTLNLFMPVDNLIHLHSSQKSRNR